MRGRCGLRSMSVSVPQTASDREWGEQFMGRGVERTGMGGDVGREGETRHHVLRGMSKGNRRTGLGWLPEVVFRAKFGVHGGLRMDGSSPWESSMGERLWLCSDRWQRQRRWRGEEDDIWVLYHDVRVYILLSIVLLGLCLTTIDVSLHVFFIPLWQGVIGSNPTTRSRDSPTPLSGR